MRSVKRILEIGQKSDQQLAREVTKRYRFRKLGQGTRNTIAEYIRHQEFPFSAPDLQKYLKDFSGFRVSY